MSLSIEQLVMHFKHDVGRAFDPAAILALCGSVGHVWRTRQLDPVVTLQAFVLQVLHGNTACSHVPRLLGIDVTAEAYGQARSRLPLEFFQRLLEEVCSRLRGSIDTASSWHGHRVWVIDGSSCSMLDTPELQQAFGQPSGQAPGCGFPVALYAKRWEVETDLRHLKQTLGMDVLRTKSLDGIHKELAMFAIVYNLVRLAMLEAAQRRQIDPERVSFVDALRWLRCVGQGGSSLRPIGVVPERPGRHDPRVKKRRPKNYRLMTTPRADLLQVLATQALSP